MITKEILTIFYRVGIIRTDIKFNDKQKQQTK